MSARFVDALKGYEYFVSKRGRPTRSQINQHLRSQGRKPISLRTYSHYQSLRENGFRSYIPINKFDVFQALGQLPLSPDRRMYSREETEDAVQASIDGREWFHATLVDRSIVGLGAVTLHKIRAKKGTPIWIRLEGHDHIPATLVWSRPERPSTRFGVRALQFIAEYALVPPPAPVERLTHTLRLVHASEQPLSWPELFRILRKTNDLLDAAQELAYTLGDAAGSPIHLSPPIVSSIRISSPGEIQVKIDFGIAEIIRIVLEKLQYWGLQKKRYRLETDGVRLGNEKAELENANLRLEVARNAVNLGKQAREEGLALEVVESLVLPSLRTLGIDTLPEGLFDPQSIEAGIVAQRLLPAAAELVAGDDPDLKVEVTEVPR